MVYQCEKAMNDLGDKIDPADKSDVEAKIADVKKALEGTDTAAIKAASDALQQKFYDISAKAYQAANPQGAQGDPNFGGAQGAQQGGDDDYIVVDEDDNK